MLSELGVHQVFSILGELLFICYSAHSLQVCTNRREVDKHVTGFPGAEFKSYATQEEAVADWQQFRDDFEAFRIARRAARLIRSASRNTLGA
ncbi:hypothetical protein BDR05DRAFT_221594 [Suillus weaverae]|nr:hypothetical protein BDR05DRAFT_221594 [Suillus weaverae]